MSKAHHTTPGIGSLIRRMQLVVMALQTLLLSGCDLTYYSQAAWGHWQLTRSQVPLEKAKQDKRFNQKEQERLSRVPDFLDFASQSLALPAEGQYRTVVFMENPTVTWNVFAAPALSLKPKTWCFPVAGCMSYRGYFKKDAAEHFAQKLQKAGWETYISPATAYSTLGWFDDPLLSSFAALDTPDLMGLIFHELAHQQLYIKGDTTFNESFATTVARAGVQRWHEQHPEETSLEDYQLRGEIQRSFLVLALETKAQLSELYEQLDDKSKAQSLEEKQAIIANFKHKYGQKVLHEWQGAQPFGQWMQGPLNNAQWNTLDAYYTLVPALTALLNRYNGDFRAFYAACKDLEELTKDERHRFLAAMESPALEKALD